MRDNAYGLLFRIGLWYSSISFPSKSHMRLVDYYNDMNDEQKAEFCKQTMIPKGVSLEFENFEKFYEARKAILTEKIVSC